MKEKIIEIVEIGQVQSLIQRENAPITELIKTDLLIEELNEQLMLRNVNHRSEQLVAFCRWYNQAIPSYETTEDEIVETYLRESN